MKNQNNTAIPNWADLCYDILVKIVLNLNIMDVICSVSFVCSSWRSACCDKRIWKSLDLSNLSSHRFVTIPREPFSGEDDENSEKLMAIIKRAASLCGDNVTRLIFNYFIVITDEHLVYLAKRCPNIKHVSLPAWNQISVNGFRKAIEHWPGLESMTFANNICSPLEVMQMIGEKCKNFYALKVMCPFNIGFANAIVALTPQIKVLSLCCSIVYMDALSIILNGLHELEVLNVFHCFLIGIPHPPGPVSIEDNEMADIIVGTNKRLKKLIFCRKNTCLLCFVNSGGEDEQEWYLHEEELWKMDMVGSLS